MPIKYIPYYPEPIDGQAILNNFTRTQRYLKYKDSSNLETSIAKGMPMYEPKLLEKVGDNPNNNFVIRGECLSTCAFLKENGVKVDLVYIDPPFASGADYAKKVYVRNNPAAPKQATDEETVLDNDDLKAFEETMYGDVWNKEAYLNWMYENLLAIKAVMSDTASIYVHLDWHIGHYVKILMDEIFGEGNFKNEIIWNYGTYIGQTTNNFPRKHDTLFLYRKSNECVFNMIRDDDLDSDANYKRWKKYFNENNQICGDNYPEDDTKFDGYVKRFIEEKGRKPSLPTDVILDISGKVVDDVWYIGSVNPFANERLDYATQKPEELLERIINASSNEGMVVADFFGGSGVTAAVASKLNRKFITCDVGINSIQTMRDRLLSIGAQFDVVEIQDGVSLYRNPKQTMNKLQQLIRGLKNENGLGKFWAGAIQDSKLGLVPVYVPNLVEGTGRILNTRLANEIIHIALPDLSDKNVKKVIVYYIDIDDKAELEKFIHEQNDTEIEIELRDMKEILSEVVVSDDVAYRVGENEIEIVKFTSDRVQQKIEEYNQKKRENSTKKGEAYTPLQVSDAGLELIELVSLDCTSNNGAWTSDSEIKIERDNYVTVNGTKTKDFWDGKITFSNKPLRMKLRNICGDEIVVDIK